MKLPQELGYYLFCFKVYKGHIEYKVLRVSDYYGHPQIIDDQGHSYNEQYIVGWWELPEPNGELK